MTPASRTNCVVGDDHELLRRGMSSLFTAEGGLSLVGEAGSGDEALELIERSRPDVAVLEARLPGMDGLEVCRQVGTRGLPTRIVLYTAHRDLDLLEDALAAGASGYVVKTSPPADLVRAVRGVHAGRPYVDAELAAGLLGRRSRRDGALLSPREREVLQLLSHGLTTDGVGRDLYLSPATVRSYAESAIRKLGAENRLHAVANALRLAVIE